MGRKRKTPPDARQPAAPSDAALPNGGPPRRPADAEALPINKHFAERYQTAKRKQLLSTVPAAALADDSADDSSSEEEEDHFAEQLTKGIDRRVRETLHAIRNKDPRIYDRNTSFFEAGGDSSAEGEEGEDSVSESHYDSDEEPVAGWEAVAEGAKLETTKMTLKDYVRETLLKDGKLADSDDDDADGGKDEGYRHPDANHHRTESPDHPAQNGTTSLPGQTDSDEESDADNFFKKKDKSTAELDAEQQDFDNFLRKQSRKTSQKAGEELLLHSYLENEKPDEKERFLRDFVLNNGWLDKNAAIAPAAGDYEIEVDTNDPDRSDGEPDADDDFEDKAEDFEAQYNFRFEDPDGAQVVSHARTVADSMRRPDDRRKKAREARKLRKQQEKLVKTEEIKHLKNLKRKEVKARLLAIQEAAGDGVDVSGIDLDADFDPDQFNRQMESKFGDEYYSQKDEDMKQITKEGLATATEKRLEAKESDEVSKDLREDVNRLMDEYYNLDYEDIVAGVPMRFNYKKVDPEAFNMTAEEVLRMEDKELNRIVSMKYLAPYRANRDIKKQSWRVHNALKMKRQSQRMHGENVSKQSALHEIANSKEEADGASKKHDNKRKRKRKHSHADDREDRGKGGNVFEAPDRNENTVAGEEGKTAKSSKKRKRKRRTPAETVDSLSSSRKKAYNID